MSDHTEAASRPLIAPLVAEIPGLAWTEIRAAAVDLARHGWPVLPGTYQFTGDGAWLGKRDAAGLEPVTPLWQLATTTVPEVALERWTRRPYSVLLACGLGINAVEVPATHGQRTLARLPLLDRGPVVATPFGSWLFFVRGDSEPLRPELAANAHGQLHANGSWLPLPPTTREGVSHRWMVSPADVGWVLPASAGVQRVLVASLERAASGTRPNLA